MNPLTGKRNEIGSFQKWELGVITSTRRSIAKRAAVQEREAGFVNLTGAIGWLFGVRSESRHEMTLTKLLSTSAKFWICSTRIASSGSSPWTGGRS
jgi:hypothetical protein